MAITPWGEVAGRLDHDQPGVLEVTITPSAVENARKRIPAWRQRQSAPILPE
jgi:predicted amidohydrolase